MLNWLKGKDLHQQVDEDQSKQLKYLEVILYEESSQ